MNIKFEKVEASKANKVYIRLNFEGGDADTQHPQEILVNDITFDDWEKNKHIIDEYVSDFKILKKVLTDSDIDYEEVLEEYGEDIANLYDNTPNDPQCDYQFKCYLDSIEIIGYDSESNKYSAYVR